MDELWGMTLALENQWRNVPLRDNVDFYEGRVFWEWRSEGRCFNHIFFLIIHVMHKSHVGRVHGHVSGHMNVCIIGKTNEPPQVTWVFRSRESSRSKWRDFATRFIDLFFVVLFSPELVMHLVLLCPWFYLLDDLPVLANHLVTHLHHHYPRFVDHPVSGNTCITWIRVLTSSMITDSRSMVMFWVCDLLNGPWLHILLHLVIDKIHCAFIDMKGLHVDPHASIVWT